MANGHVARPPATQKIRNPFANVNAFSNSIRGKMLSHLILLPATLLLNSVPSLSSNVEIFTVVMQLRSNVVADSDDLLSAMLETTEDYMDEYFAAYCEIESRANCFSFAGLGVDSLGIHEMAGSYVTTLNF